jgi:NAD(P)H-quinone oxidoreductase subunit 5
MIAFLSLAIAWGIPALLVWSLVSTSYLNQHATRLFVLGEKLAWAVCASILSALLAWILTGAVTFDLCLSAAKLIGIRGDALSFALALLVSFLGALILRFSKNYLAGDRAQGYFLKWMSVTLAAVLAQVMAPGLFQFALAWIVGSLSLHKLLIYFPDRHGTVLSARKKAFWGRISDVALIVAFIGIYRSFGVQDFTQLFAALETVNSLPNLTWIAALLILSALIQSAQVPFHTWLPDTMGAPTPVSAFMHAGIINGGGFLAIRLSQFFVHTPNALSVLAICGALTAVYGAMVMLSQTSVKRALAYSTIAQMGFMLLQCGLGAFHIAVLHLLAHSLYKAHAFLTCGSAVETAKKLKAKPHYRRLNPKRIWLAISVSLAIVVGLSIAFELSPSKKPGMLVLSLVVVMALTQLLWTAMRRGQQGIAFAGSVGVAGSIAALYFFLAQMAYYFFSSAVAMRSDSAWVLELFIAAVLLLFLITSIRFQDGEPGFLSVAYKRRLYVHALNGFYMNTVANRLARKLGLVAKHQ